MHLAVDQDHQHVVEELISAGANTDVTDQVIRLASCVCSEENLYILVSASWTC